MSFSDDSSPLTPLEHSNLVNDVSSLSHNQWKNVSNATKWNVVSSQWNVSSSFTQNTTKKCDDDAVWF